MFVRVEWTHWPGIYVAAGKKFEVNLIILMCHSVLNTFVIIAYTLELFASRRMFSEQTAMFLIGTNILSALFIPTYLVWSVEMNPGM